MSIDGGSITQRSKKVSWYNEGVKTLSDPLSKHDYLSPSYLPGEPVPLSRLERGFEVKIEEHDEADEELPPESPDLKSKKQKKYTKILLLICLAGMVAAVMYFAGTVDYLTSRSRSDEKPLSSEGGPGEMSPVINSNLANVTDYSSRYALPLFFHVPLSGGTIVESILGKCLRLVQASKAGALIIDNYSQNVLRIVDVQEDSYINVDTTTSEGLDRAMELDLVGSGLPDVVISPLLYEASQKLFRTSRSSDQLGIMFSIFRHPIERAVHTFNYLKGAKWDPRYTDDLSRMSLTEYAESKYAENNLLTRLLSNHTGGKLEDSHLYKAQDVLRRKCIVGLYSQLEQSMERFERHFGWKVSQPWVKKCHNEEIKRGNDRYEEAVGGESIEKGNEAWVLLEQQNNYDMALYEYIEKLYEYQGENLVM